MAFILNIETATTVCSVSISENDTLIALKEIDNGFTHAENLHVFINELLIQTNLRPTDINAVAVSKGPGSYTGLRIGVSAAKGLCYALNIPLISLSTLKVMANSIEVRKENVFYCPMLDARRMEVYTTLFDSGLNEVSPTEALIVDEQSIEKFKNYSAVYFFGDGMPKCKDVLSYIPQAYFIENIKPSSKCMINLADKKFKEKNFEDVAYFEPFYLKDFMISTKK
ncbi:MAG: tRNA (adenosine(37)-N6)-threonylcarbamoyltransferase complex dimerization subunit type 1 TsaB [Bacteroidota bacterium]|nr:tRNA (adenosine(37)-N6)-threonylcarbamoyltransferase complex dimerization subunit type 1 TsaB [Bacteroidota bacterium]